MKLSIMPEQNLAGVAELVDAPDSKSGFFGSAGSIPALGTKFLFQEVPERPAAPITQGFFIARYSCTVPAHPKKYPHVWGYFWGYF